MAARRWPPGCGSPPVRLVRDLLGVGPPFRGLPARAALEEELAEIYAAGHGVPTTRKGLATLGDAIAGQRAELERVNRALGEVDEAEQQRVDELAAAEALGEVDEAEQRAAATDLT